MYLSFGTAVPPTKVLRFCSGIISIPGQLGCGGTLGLLHNSKIILTTPRPRSTWASYVRWLADGAFVQSARMLFCRRPSSYLRRAHRFKNRQIQKDGGVPRPAATLICPGGQSFEGGVMPCQQNPSSTGCFMFSTQQYSFIIHTYNIINSSTISEAWRVYLLTCWVFHTAALIYILVHR